MALLIVLVKMRCNVSPFFPFCTWLYELNVVRQVIASLRFDVVNSQFADGNMKEASELEVTKTHDNFLALG